MENNYLVFVAKSARKHLKTVNISLVKYYINIRVVDLYCTECSTAYTEKKCYNLIINVVKSYNRLQAQIQ